MNKIIFTIFAALSTINLNAQLVVDSLGRVGIGTETPRSLLSVGTSGSDIVVFDCETNNKRRAMSSVNKFNSTSQTIGISSYARNHLGKCIGVWGEAYGKYDTISTQRAIGVYGIGGHSYTSVGVFGGSTLGTSSPVNYAGIYGTTGTAPTFSSYSGKYAGFFSGKVRVTNGIYATLLSPTAPAATSIQSGASTLSNESESVTDKLSKVSTVQFLRYNPTEEGTIAKKVTKHNFVDIDTDNLTPKELDALEEDFDEEPEQYLSLIQYGLAADQLKAVYPELVYEDANGNVSINYVEMVPLLVQSINELSAKVAKLEGTSPKKSKTKAETTSIDETVADVDMVRMDQNKPNPFSESTVITLNVPEQAQKASIFIYDMSGKQVQSIPVSERGETNITVYASYLTVGMYIYALVVDGKVSVTRKMIVTI